MNDGWDNALPRYATVEWFYREGDEQGLPRRYSGEADYGFYWWDGPQGHSDAWRVSAVQDTGEIYAALERVNTRHGEPRVVLLGTVGPDPGYKEADKLLEGWNLECGKDDSLRWVVDTVLAGSPAARTGKVSDYERGFRDGVAAYAHWKDGTQFVGTTGRTLAQALTDVRSTWNFSEGAAGVAGPPDPV